MESRMKQASEDASENTNAPGADAPSRARAQLARLALFFFALAAPSAARAGTVNGSLFIDLNADGIRQTAQGETGSGGAAINLKRDGGNGIIGDGDDVTVASDITGGADGSYSFTGVAAGTYYVNVDLSPFITGFLISPQDQGSDDTLDSDFDPTTGNTPAFTLTSSGTVTRDVGFVPMRLRSASGSNAAAIQSTVDDFRGDLGSLNPNVAGSANGGRREINWDGVPAQFAAPNNMPSNFFNSNSPRGAVFSTPGSGFQVSGATGDSGTGQPAAARFGNINSTYTADFQTFSPQRLFTALGSNITDVNFFVPGSTTPGFVLGFGSVFTDVETAGSTTIEFFNQNGASLGKHAVPTSPDHGLSFLGLSFTGTSERVISRVRITSGAAALGAAESSDDLVVMDDFIYGEPVPNANLVVNGIDSPDPVVAGSNVTYNIVLFNNGTADAQNVTLTDPTPSQTTFVSFSQTAGPASTINTPAGGSTGTVTVTFPTLAAGSSASFTMVVRANTGAVGSTTNSPRATSNPPDTIATDNLTNIITNFIAQADLSVTKTGPANATVGGDVTYNLSVSNAGPSDAQAVALSDPLPANTTFVSLTQNSGPAATFAVPAVGAGGTAQANIPTLAAGASAAFTLVAHVTSAVPAGSTISNTATVSSTTTDTAAGNNSATAAPTAVPPTLSINDVTAAEGNSGSTNATFAVTLSNALDRTVTVDFVTSNGTATTPADYQAVGGTLTFAPGQTTRNIIVPVNGDTATEGNETFFVNLTNPTGATLADAQGLGTIVDDDAAQSTFSFSQPSYGGQESADGVTVTVLRSGDTSAPASVNYRTSDATASDRTDYTFAAGTLRFAPGQTAKTFTVLISQDSFAEGTETATLTLSNPSAGSALGTQSTASVVVVDEVPESATNPIDDSQTFVRQHYHDFLNRVPDDAGLQFWTSGIESCGADSQCREVKRVDTSAAFFLSIEFQETGFLVERVYRAAYNRRPHIGEFLADTQEVGRGVVVGRPGFAPTLEANKQSYFDEFAARPEFGAVFGGLSNEQFVDALNADTGGALSASERDALAAALNSSTKTRAQVLRAVAEDADFAASELRPAFVLMQYFGYLRRDPDDAGFQFWLAKLNQFGGDFQKAEMVRAFISSAEYRQRFGQQ